MTKSPYTQNHKCSLIVTHKNCVIKTCPCSRSHQYYFEYLVVNSWYAQGLNIWIECICMNIWLQLHVVNNIIPFYGMWNVGACDVDEHTRNMQLKVYNCFGHIGGFQVKSSAE